MPLLIAPVNGFGALQGAFGPLLSRKRCQIKKVSKILNFSPEAILSVQRGTFKNIRGLPYVNLPNQTYSYWCQKGPNNRVGGN